MTLKNPKIPKAILDKLSYHQRKIALHRDALRGVIEEVEGVLDSSDRALEDLQRAIDALSEYL